MQRGHEVGLLPAATEISDVISPATDGTIGRRPMPLQQALVIRVEADRSAIARDAIDGPEPARAPADL